MEFKELKEQIQRLLPLRKFLSKKEFAILLVRSLYGLNETELSKKTKVDIEELAYEIYQLKLKLSQILSQELSTITPASIDDANKLLKSWLNVKMHKTYDKFLAYAEHDSRKPQASKNDSERKRKHNITRSLINQVPKILIEQIQDGLRVTHTSIHQLIKTLRQVCNGENLAKIIPKLGLDKEESNSFALLRKQNYYLSKMSKRQLGAIQRVATKMKSFIMKTIIANQEKYVNEPQNRSRKPQHSKFRQNV